MSIRNGKAREGAFDASQSCLNLYWKISVYNLTLSASGVGCAAGQTTMSDIVYLDAKVTPNKFLSLALTPSKNDGVIVIGTKR